MVDKKGETSRFSSVMSHHTATELHQSCIRAATELQLLHTHSRLVSHHTGCRFSNCFFWDCHDLDERKEDGEEEREAGEMSSSLSL